MTNDPEHACIGRERELARLELAIGRPGDGMRLALVRGEAGAGATTVVAQASQDAAARGFRVVVVDGRASAHAAPLAPLAAAFPDAGIDDGMDADRVGTVLAAALAASTPDAPVLVVVDDACLLDDSSIAALQHVLQAGDRLQLSLLLVEQTDALEEGDSYRAFVEGLLATRVVDTLDLHPLREDDVRALVARRLGLAHPEDVPAHVVTHAHGNPWFACELAASWAVGSSSVPKTIADAAALRLRSLDEVSRDLLRAMAVCDDGAPRVWLELLCDRSPASIARTCDGLISSGIVRCDDDVMSIAHPLMRRALVETTSPAMRRAMHLELACAIIERPISEVADARARAKHLHAAGRSIEAVQLLLRAADRSERDRQLHETYADLVRALAIEARVDARGPILRRAGTLAMQVDRGSAVEYWNELGRIAASQGDNEAYAHALVHQYWTANDGKAFDRLERAAALGSDVHGWSARAAANVASLAGDLTGSMRHERRALELAREAGDAILETTSLHRLGVCLALSGRHEEAVEVLRDASACAVEHHQHQRAITIWGDLADDLAEHLDVDGAVETTRTALEYVKQRELDRLRPTAVAYHALNVLRQGNVHAARALLEPVHATSAYADDIMLAPLVGLQWVDVCTECGDAGIDAALRAAIDLVERAGVSSWREQLRINEARAAARTSMITAIGHLELLDATDEPMMLAEATLWLVRASCLQQDVAGIEYGREMLDRFPSDGGGRYVDLARRELVATLAATSDADAVRALEAIADEWSAAGRMLDALRVLAVAGSIELTAGRTDEGMCKLREARAGFAERGASPDADLVASILRGAGAGSRARTFATSVGSLTARELEVARLVSQGMRNADAAERLRITRRTVTEHLSNIYSKLELASRVQLAEWMRANDQPRASAAQPRSDGGIIASTRRAQAAAADQPTVA